MLKCETIELTANEVIKKEYRNISPVVCATASIMNICDSDVLISNESNFENGNYITIPPGAAYNSWKFNTTTTIYFKCEDTGKVTIGISKGW